MKNLSLLLPLKNSENNLAPRYFYGILLSICAAYFGLEIYYITHSIFSVDDFWLAYHTYHYKIALPYRDFPPYKTVLGYYLMVLPMLVTHGTVATLLAVKLLLACVNTLCLVLTGQWLKKVFSPSSALLAVGLIASTFCFLAYSAEIRVDLLAYWLCLFSLLFLLEQKWLAGGTCIGLALLFSQKAIWSVFAIDGALLISAGWHALRPLLKVNSIMALVVGLYILIWSSLASFHAVFTSVFYEAYVIAHLTDYQAAVANFWKITLGQNVVLYLAAAAGWLCLLLPPTRLPKPQRVFIATYTFIMAWFFFSYRQPFSYHLLAMLPAIALLLAVLSDWVFALFHQRLARLVFIFGLVAGNLGFTTASYLLTAKDNHYQRNMLGLMEQLLRDPDENYVAGVPFIYNKETAVPGLTHLTVPQLGYLYRPAQEKQKFMLASLYLAPVTQTQVLLSLVEAPVKFYIANNRIAALPPALKTFLALEYQHFWGSIYLYAPTIAAGEQGVIIKFGGYYKVKAPNAVTIDGKIYLPGTIATLHPGSHVSVASISYRLQLVPEIAAKYLDFKWVGENSSAIIS